MRGNLPINNGSAFKAVYLAFLIELDYSPDVDVLALGLVGGVGRVEVALEGFDAGGDVEDDGDGDCGGEFEVAFAIFFVVFLVILLAILLIILLVRHGS